MCTLPCHLGEGLAIVCLSVILNAVAPFSYDYFRFFLSLRPAYGGAFCIYFVDGLLSQVGFELDWFVHMFVILGFWFCFCAMPSGWVWICLSWKCCSNFICKHVLWDDEFRDKFCRKQLQDWYYRTFSVWSILWHPLSGLAYRCLEPNEALCVCVCMSSIIPVSSFPCSEANLTGTTLEFCYILNQKLKKQKGANQFFFFKKKKQKGAFVPGVSHNRIIICGACQAASLLPGAA